MSEDDAGPQESSLHPALCPPSRQTLEEGGLMGNPDRDLRAGELEIPKRRQEVEKPQGEVTFVSRVWQPKW